MNFIDILKERKSVRFYQRKKISDEKIYTILKAGKLAPSAADKQPWLFIVVKDLRIRKKIREECERVDEVWHRKAPSDIRRWLRKKNITSEKKFLTEAPVLICVFGDKKSPYWYESVWVSIAYITLAVVEEGLGTVIYTPGDSSFLNDFLNVPDNFEPLAILPLGYPSEIEGVKPVKKIRYNNRVYVNRYVKESNHKFAQKTEEIVYEIPLLDKDDPEIKRCACGCGQPVVGLNRKRKYIPGHSRFGKNGILRVLKNPPLCRCGCGKTVSWNWESMKWNRYHDPSHQKSIAMKKNKKDSDQIDLFNS